MIDVVRENLGRYWSFLDECRRILFSPFDEVKYLSGRDKDQRTTILYFAFAVVTITAVDQLTRGRDLSDFQVHLLALIMHALAVLAGFLSLALAWRVVGHKVDIGRVIRIDLYLASTIVLVDAFISTLTTGVQKMFFFEELQKFQAFAADCALTPFEKISGLESKLDVFRNIILTEAPGQAVFILLSIWFALVAIRLKYHLFPLGFFRVIAALLLACLFFAVFWPVSMILNFAFIEPICK